MKMIQTNGFIKEEDIGYTRVHTCITIKDTVKGTKKSFDFEGIEVEKDIDGKYVTTEDVFFEYEGKEYRIAKSSNLENGFDSCLDKFEVEKEARVMKHIEKNQIKKIGNKMQKIYSKGEIVLEKAWKNEDGTIEGLRKVYPTLTIIDDEKNTKKKIELDGIEVKSQQIADRGPYMYLTTEDVFFEYEGKEYKIAKTSNLEDGWDCWLDKFEVERPSRRIGNVTREIMNHEEKERLYKIECEYELNKMKEELIPWFGEEVYVKKNCICVDNKIIVRQNTSGRYTNDYDLAYENQLFEKEEVFEKIGVGLSLNEMVIKENFQQIKKEEYER